MEVQEPEALVGVVVGTGDTAVVTGIPVVVVVDTVVEGVEAGVAVVAAEGGPDIVVDVLLAVAEVEALVDTGVQGVDCLA